jgi:hypothetical protein
MDREYPCVRLITEPPFLGAGASFYKQLAGSPRFCTASAWSLSGPPPHSQVRDENAVQVNDSVRLSH